MTAASQAAKHKPITDPSVRKLLDKVGTIGSSAPGTEQQKSHDFARMKSATVYFGLPQIFVTFNPADNVSPVALFYAGEKIDVQTFHPKLYSAAKRLGTMLHNPLAVVEYFRNTVDTIVKTMLKGGTFGELVHYHGPVEYLGRGPPHTHLLVISPQACPLTGQLWIKGAGTPQSVQNKAKEDPTYRQRILEYIEQVCSQCMPDEAVDDESPESGSRVFQPLIPPHHQDFDEAMKVDVFDIVRSRQFHNENHLPVCFKYQSKRCRFRFPRLLVPTTTFDEFTGVILQKRDRQWLNNYNRWFSLVMRANHDCQYLFSQTEALAKIYYVMKYITKAEESMQSKLTIAAAVLKAISKSTRNDKGKAMLIRTYNKISSHREVGIPEMILHILDFPKTLTGATFEKIHTTHLLNSIKTLNGEQDELTPTYLGDSSIIHVRNKTTIISSFDDYAHRGPRLENMCMYDYVSLVYKSTDDGGLPFDPSHPQHLTNRQFTQKTGIAIPTLLEKLLFLRPDSGEESVRNEHFCIVSALFVPWSHDKPLQKPNDRSWEDFFVEDTFASCPPSEIHREPRPCAQIEGRSSHRSTPAARSTRRRRKF
jgi:Helitron helicase-like domain at N-terminus